MYGIYGDLIGAAESALEKYGETKELLEYPEVQVDKAYYLSVLSMYNKLNFLKDRLDALKGALKEKEETYALLSDAHTAEDINAVYAEIFSLDKIAAELSASLSDALGCKHTEERVYCRFKLREAASKFGEAFYNLLKEYFYGRGIKLLNEDFITAKGVVKEISFTAEGADLLTRLSPLTGAHRVYFAGAKSEELCFAVTIAERIEEISENDLKIDVFHSSGAGGQNINKVETAVRVTHVPTGLSVVCQDERSQLKNKKRALETIENRLKERRAQAEKKRIEADISAQYSKKNTPISFDATNFTMTDTRLKAFTKIAFPMTEKEFISYINGLTALC